jgi:hypothetical protein
MEYISVRRITEIRSCGTDIMVKRAYDNRTHHLRIFPTCPTTWQITRGQTHLKIIGLGKIPSGAHILRSTKGELFLGLFPLK